jgi:integrase
LKIPNLKQPDPLPKFLTDDQVRLLKEDFEQRVLQAVDFRQRRDTLLDRAAFYLLWLSGLRLGEVEELRLEDLDLGGRKLMVRQSKGLKDRVVYMTNITIGAFRRTWRCADQAPPITFSCIATNRCPKIWYAAGSKRPGNAWE